MSTSPLKSALVAPLRTALRLTAGLREQARRLYFHAALAAHLHEPLPASVVVLGRAHVYGTGAISFGPDTLLYPELHLETQASARIRLGAGVVLSRGVHLVAMQGILIGPGTMIGEYTSLRDSNHTRTPDTTLRDSAHTGRPITLGREVWVGRGVTILAGVTIGDHATIAANAVVTHDVPAHATVGGVPARPLHSASPRTET